MRKWKFVNSMKRSSGWKWLLVISLLLILAFGGAGVLIYVDKHYVCLRSRLVRILGRENHFDGESWFSAAATLVGAFISAIPGLMCGILAYIQTNRLHDLEDRYRRPGIELRSAQIGAVNLRIEKNLRIDKNKLQEIKVGFPELDCVYRYGIEDAYKQQYPFYIHFEAEFCVRNDITIKELYIKQITFMLGGESWEINFSSEKSQLETFRHMTWDFNRKIVEGGMTYMLECSLCPSVGAWNQNQSDTFWDAIQHFVFYRSEENLVHRYMVLNLRLSVMYEYGASEGAEGILHMEFDGKGNYHEEPVLKSSLSNGFFSFDI